MAALLSMLKQVVGEECGMINVVILSEHNTQDVLDMLDVLSRAALDIDLLANVDPEHVEQYAIHKSDDLVTLYYHDNTLRAMSRGVPADEALLRLLKTIY